MANGHAMKFALGFTIDRILLAIGYLIALIVFGLLLYTTISGV